MAPPHSQASHANSCKESAQSSVASALNFVCVPACCLLPTAPVCQPRPVGLLQPAIDQFPRRQRPLQRTSIIGQRAQPSSATCNWRHRVDASDRESGGRAARHDEDEHARRAAAPSHLQSSFSHTCSPYAALWRAALGEGGGTQRRAVKYEYMRHV